MKMRVKRIYIHFITVFTITRQCLSSKPSASVQLNSDNIERLTKGKTVFIKFFSPECPHCKDIEKAWEDLSFKWENHAVGLVGEIDCTNRESGGEQLCRRFKVLGFPTLKYGEIITSSSTGLTEYNGGKTLEYLSEFAKTILVPICSPTNLGACESPVAAQIRSYEALGEEELDRAIAEKEGQISEAERIFDAEVENMTKFYDQIMIYKENRVAALRSSIKLIQSIMDSKISSF